ncbi:MAG: hypothetical protein J6V72_14840 [Kiritimatiellae bacterium]|nr:hypothetical protein [Kiritimatiellia bacterium]
MGISLEAVNELEDAIDRKIRQAAAKQTRAYGEVSRIEADGTVYVLLDGAESDTPASANAAAVKEGERVSVTVDGGRMVIDGNYSAPATDDTAAHAAQVTANAALQSADVAANAAAEAQSSAAVAAGAAEDAVEAAEAAQDSLKSVVQGATTVEKAVSVMQTALEAVVDYDPTNDTVQEYFWHDANGAHVLGDTSGYRNDITSSGMDIVTVADERSVAQFGADGARIGRDYDSQASDNESHIELDYHSIQFIDKEGNTYFHVSDLRDASGNVTLSETFIGDGTKTTFSLSLDFDSVVTVTVDGDTVPYTVTSNTSVRLDTAPSDGAKVRVRFVTSSHWAKGYSLGFRNTTPGIGALSSSFGWMTTASGSRSHAEGEWTEATAQDSHSEGYHTVASRIASHAEGYHTVASGEYAHAEGYYTTASANSSHAEGSNTEASEYCDHSEGYSTTASGSCAHAEGRDTIASGICSHAEGDKAVASGNNSHAQNLGTLAENTAQTALGMYNMEDRNGDFAVIVGNGTADNARSNALAVDWNGNVLIGGNVQNLSGNALYYSAQASRTANTVLAAPNGSAGAATFRKLVAADVTGLGTVVTNDISTAVSVASASYKSLGSVELVAGKWVVDYGAQFANNATGRRYMLLHTSANAQTANALRQTGVTANAVDGAGTYLHSSHTFNLSSAATYYLNVWQNSGAAMNCYGYIRAIRIA